MSEFFEQKYRVRYSDAGVSGFLRPWMFFNLFQDAASVHAFNEGVSALHMAEKGLTWVVRAYSLEIKSFPVWNEELRIRTWRFPFKNLYELRSYEVTGSSGQVYAFAKSAWVLVKIDSGQPVRLGKNLPPELPSGPHIDFGIPDLPASEFEPESGNGSGIINKTRFEVHAWDLDYNRHANNAVFIKWLIESLPSDIPETWIKNIDAVFMKSAYMGNSLDCCMKRRNNGQDESFICGIFSPDTAQGILRAEIRCSVTSKPVGAFDRSINETIDRASL